MKNTKFLAKTPFFAWNSIHPYRHIAIETFTHTHYRHAKDKAEIAAASDVKRKTSFREFLNENTWDAHRGQRN